MPKQKSLDTKALKNYLEAELFDQTLAVERVTQTLFKEAFLEHKKPFRAFFTFIGPQNSGKHYLAEKLQAFDPAIETLKTFHMDSYIENESTSVANSFAEELLGYIVEHPQVIMVFEDIEKADLQVQLMLYTLLSDTSEHSVDMSGVIFIVTTTRASHLLSRSDFKQLLKQEYQRAVSLLIENLSHARMHIAGTLEEAFDSKLLSLMHANSIVVFNTLTLSSLIKIGARALNSMSRHFLEQSHIELEYIAFDKLVSMLTLSLAPYLNAKYIKEQLPELLFSHLYQAIVQDETVSKICCRMSQKAEAFLEEVMQDQVQLLKRLREQHFRLSLEWDSFKEADTMVCEIKSAAFSKEPLSLGVERGFRSADIDFESIAGHKQVKKELMQMARLIKDEKRLAYFSLQAPKGMLLLGDAHIGKKMLAQAFAAEVDMPFQALSGAELFDEEKIHLLYEEAKKMAPSIVLLEDIDIQGIMGGVLSPVLPDPFIKELDALSQGRELEVFTIATAASIPSGLEALFATGYLDIKIDVPKLDMQARRFFIEQILKLPCDKNIDVDKVVRYISGMDGKELQEIGTAVALEAARKGKKKITQEMLLEQINSIKYGSKLETKQIRDLEKSMESTAYHEAGHAVLSYFLMPETKIEQVTVTPRRDALGFVSYRNEEFIDATSKEELFNNICVLMGGRAATIEKYGKEGLETGAVNDLEVANMHIYAAIALFGMDEELGNLSLSGIEQGYQKDLFKEKIEKRMLVWLERAEQKAAQTVKSHWNAIEAVAQRLIKEELIDGDELVSIIKMS